MKTKKSIKFIVGENERPIDVVRMLRDMLNIRYHHHYYHNGEYFLEYFEND